MDKQTLRRAAKERRLLMSNSDVADESEKIINHLKQKIDWKNIKSLHLYSANAHMHEPITQGFRDFIWQNHPAVVTYAPRLHSNTMEAVVVTKDSWFEDNMRGIPEPAEGEMVAPSSIDVIIVPLLAFDEQLHRMGYGGGYYDRLLAQYPDAKKIGLAFEADKLTAVPQEEHDVLLDMVITEASIYLPQKQ